MSEGVGGGAQSRNTLEHSPRWDCSSRECVLMRYTAWYERFLETGDPGVPNPRDDGPHLSF